MLMVVACAMYRHTIGSSINNVVSRGRDGLQYRTIYKPYLLTRQIRPGKVRGGY